MSVFLQTRRFRSFLVGLLVSTILLTSSAFAPGREAEAAAKAPAISKSSGDLLVGGELKLSVKNGGKSAAGLWKSSDKSVAAVDKAGVVKGVAQGKAKITCTVKTMKKTYNLSSTITVRIPAKSIKINNKVKELKVGETYNLNRTITPKSSNDRTFWTSSDPSVAKPDKNGKIKIFKEGTVTITAKTLSGQKDSVKIKAVPAMSTKTLTKKDIKDGRIKLSDVTYDRITIDSNVGNAEIILENVKVRDTLEMATNAQYTVRAIKSEITRVVSLEEKTELVSMAVGDTSIAAPTFIAGEGTLVVTVDARGNVSVKQEGEAKIGTVTVNRSVDGSLSLKLEGFEGNLVVNTVSNADIDITTKNCSIGETVISGSSAGQKLTLADDAAGGAVSSLGSIKVESNAKLSIDVPAAEVVVSDKVKEANITLGKPVEKVVNGGSATKLTVNSNIGTIVSSGEELTMKVAAGSTVKDVELSGNKATVDVALGSSIVNIVAKGNDAAISGKGSVAGVKVEGNNSKIDTADTKVEVGDKSSGTVMNGKEISPGATVTPAPVQPPSSSGPPSSDPSPTPTVPPVTEQVIKIIDPGKIVSGIPVQMRAEAADVTWEVYNFIDDTWGEAQISESGLLIPRETGTVRVVVRSKKNEESYGAVDLTITGKKFVRMEPIPAVELTADEGLLSISNLAASGKLPTKVRLVYETGNGTDTETIEVDLFGDGNWYGTYEGNRVGNYLVDSPIPVPEGYERPENLNACVVVRVKVAQSGEYVYVKSFDPLNMVTLTTDEHCVQIYEIVNKYFEGKQINLHLSDGSNRTVEVWGYYIDSGNQYNGAVPGTYTINLHAALPQNILSKRIFGGSATSIYWYNDTALTIPVTVVVSAAQTAEQQEEYSIPDTTQPKFTPVNTPATIQAVTLKDFPAQWNAGEVIDLSQYVTVTTDSVLASDQRVIWTCNGYSNEDILDSINGKLVLNRSGSVNLKAISAVDKTKYCEVILQAVNTKTITNIMPLEPITVSEDKGVYDFRSMYNSLEGELPRTLTASTDTGETLELVINGWYQIMRKDNEMLIMPIAQIPYGYQNQGQNPPLTIRIAAGQTDARITVVTGSAITSSGVLSEDRYATTAFHLMKALFGYEGRGETIPVNVTLQSGEIVELQCSVNSFYVSCENPNLLYRGEAGKYLLHYRLLLPEGYKMADESGSDFDLEIVQEITVAVGQSPRYDDLFVSVFPARMNYQAGELLDLSGIIVMYKDNSLGETSSYIFLGPDRLDEYGLELYWDDFQGERVELTAPLSKDKDGRYIFIHNPDNYSSTFFGPINITE